MENLSLNNTNVASIKELENLDKLEFLDLHGVENIDFQPIMHLPNIKYIFVDYRMKESLNRNDFKSKPYIS